MLQFFRDKLQGCIVWLIIGLIIVVFVLGASSYLFQRTYNDTLAKVDGEKISLSIVNQRYQNILSQHYAKKNYHNYDLDPIKLKQQIFSELLNQVAIIKGLQRNGFGVTEQQLLSMVKSNKKLQENGKFSRQKYLDWLHNLGIDELSYQQFLKQQLLTEQLTNIILFSNFIPSEDLDNFIFKWFQNRKIGYLIVPKSKFYKSVLIADQELENYYLAHAKDLVFPETVKMEYLDISASKLIDKITATKEQLYKYYTEHSDYYTLPELVKVRHIFVNQTSGTSQNTTAAGSGKMPSKMEEIIAKLKSGQSFTDLARQFSEDPNSAAKGGDLGWVGKGEIDPEFDNVAFSLKKPGEFSDVIKTKFGYHIIQLVEKREKRINKFEEVLDKVKQHYKEEEIQPKLQDLYSKLSDAARDNKDLTKLAEELQLPLEITGDFSSRGESSGIASYAEIVSLAFDQKDLKRNSDVIRLGEDHFVIFRVIDRKPARAKSFSEAMAEIKQILTEEYVKQQADKYIQDLALKLSKTKDRNKLARSNNLEWKTANISRDNKSIMVDIIQAAFSLSQANTQKLFKLSNGDFLILQLLQIQDPDVSKLLAQRADLKTKMEEQLLQLQSYLDQKLYEQELYNNAKIKIIKTPDQL